MVRDKTKPRTYRGGNLSEALLKVKMDLGENAVIEEQREVKEGGFFGFFQQSLVEIDAKLPQAAEVFGKKTNNKKVARKQNRKDGSREWNVNTPAAPDFSPRSHAARLIDQANGNSNNATYNRPRRPAKQETSKKPVSNFGEGMSLETKKTLEKVLANTDLLSEKVEALSERIESDPAQGSESCYPGCFNDIYQKLLKNGVEQKHARDLIGRARRLVEPHQIEDREFVRECVGDLIDEDFNHVAPMRVGEGETLLVPFIGPTGVGKTTTVAKLAAYFFGEEGKKVGFIAMDHYRLAAVDQLATYADILEAPLEDLEEESGDFARAVESLVKEQVDIIFIDTAGRSQFDAKKIENLKAFQDSEYRVVPHLVVSATSRCEDLETIVDSFSVADFERIVFTKLDETQSHGVIYNLLQKTNCPIAYFTDGQGVPGNLELAESSRLAQLILEEE